MPGPALYLRDKSPPIQILCLNSLLCFLLRNAASQSQKGVESATSQRLKTRAERDSKARGRQGGPSSAGGLCCQIDWSIFLQGVPERGLSSASDSVLGQPMASMKPWSLLPSPALASAENTLLLGKAFCTEAATCILLLGHHNILMTQAVPPPSQRRKLTQGSKSSCHWHYMAVYFLCRFEKPTISGQIKTAAQLLI